MKRFQNYAELDVWNEAKKLTFHIYNLSKNFPKDEINGLTVQMRKTSILIPAGIAEATCMYRSEDALDILFSARSGLYELESMAYVALDQFYINSEDFNTTNDQITVCKRLINGFINYYRKSKNNNGIHHSRREHSDGDTEYKTEDTHVEE